MIIDGHFHIYKDERSGLLAQGGNSVFGYTGTLNEALSFLDNGTIQKMIALAVVPVKEMKRAAVKKWPENLSTLKEEELALELEEKLQGRLARYNEWLCDIASKDSRILPAIYSDALIDPGFMINEIVEKVEKYGVRILKIHPAENGLYPDDPSYNGIYDIAVERNLTILSHGGVSPADPEARCCTPDRFENVLKFFPGLKLVIAHIAFPHYKELPRLSKKYSNLYTDLSFVLQNSTLSDDEFVSLIKDFGVSRVIFGSDFPWSDPAVCVERISNLKLSTDEIEMLCWKNASRVFGIEDQA